MSPVVVTLPKPHPAQVQVMREADRFNVLQCGRRFGKTTLGMVLACEAAIGKLPVGWFAPTNKLMTESWAEIVRTLKPIIRTSNAQERRIELTTGGVIDFWTLDNPDSGRGRKYGLVIIDEASIVRDLDVCWEHTIRPTLTDYSGLAWFFGTPKGRGYFHKLFMLGQTGEQRWKSWRFKTIDNPRMAVDEVEGARAGLPPAVFAQEYEGVPADDGGNPFGIDAIAACVEPESSAAPVVFGVDLAKSVDWTVVIGLDKSGRVCRFERWQAPWHVTEPRIADIIGDVPTLIDSTGVGDPIVESLQRGRGTVEGFKFTSTSKQQIMEGLVVAIQQARVRFPDGAIRLELESFGYEYTRTGVRYNAQEGFHDDCVCALALAVSRLARQPQAFASWQSPLVVIGGSSDDDRMWN